MPDTSAELDEALHRVQAAALEPWFAVSPRERDIEAPRLDVLEVGASRWASSFDPTKTRFVGIGLRKDSVARADFFPYDDESFDLVFSVSVMHHNPAPDKRTLLSEMWRVARPGGRLLFLEDFVFTRRTEGPDVYPMSVTEFEGLILDAMNGRVVLEHVESLRYPNEELFRSGLISLLRLGVPKTS